MCNIYVYNIYVYAIDSSILTCLENTLCIRTQYATVHQTTVTIYEIS